MKAKIQQPNGLLLPLIMTWHGKWQSTDGLHCNGVTFAMRIYLDLLGGEKMKESSVAKL